MLFIKCNIVLKSRDITCFFRYNFFNVSHCEMNYWAVYNLHIFVIYSKEKCKLSFIEICSFKFLSINGVFSLFILLVYNNYWIMLNPRSVFRYMNLVFPIVVHCSLYCIPKCIYISQHSNITCPLLIIKHSICKVAPLYRCKSAYIIPPACLLVFV